MANQSHQRDQQFQSRLNARRKEQEEEPSVGKARTNETSIGRVLIAENPRHSAFLALRRSGQKGKVPDFKSVVLTIHKPVPSSDSVLAKRFELQFISGVFRIRRNKRWTRLIIRALPVTPSDDAMGTIEPVSGRRVMGELPLHQLTKNQELIDTFPMPRLHENS